MRIEAGYAPGSNRLIVLRPIAPTWTIIERGWAQHARGDCARCAIHEAALEDSPLGRRPSNCTPCKRNPRIVHLSACRHDDSSSSVQPPVLDSIGVRSRSARQRPQGDQVDRYRSLPAGRDSMSCPSGRWLSTVIRTDRPRDSRRSVRERTVGPCRINK